MGGIGDEDARALVVSAVAVVFVDDHRADQLALGSGCGLEGGISEAANLRQPLLQGVHQIEVALDGIFRLERVGVGEARIAAGDFVDLWVVLHGTGAQRVQTEVNGIIFLGEAGEVAHNAHLGNFREGQPSARKFLREFGQRNFRFGEGNAGASGGRKLKNGRLTHAAPRLVLRSDSRYPRERSFRSLP